MDTRILDRSTEAIRNDLGVDVYVLLPQEDRYFLGEPVLLGIAAAILTSFFQGVTAAAAGRAQQWGERAGGWLIDRVARLVEHGDQVDAELTVAAAEAKGCPAVDDDVVSVLLTEALLDHGLSATATARILGSVRTAVEQIRAA